MTETDETDDSSEDPPVFNALPDQPMSKGTVSMLQQHDGVTACLPVYRLVETPTTIVGILLKTEETAGIALYNPHRGAWERLYQTETFDNVYSDDAMAARETLREQDHRVYEIYDEDTVELIQPGESELFDTGEPPFPGLLTGLPDEPVSRDLLRDFRAEPEVSEVAPHMYLAASDAVVLFTVTFTDYVENQETFGIAYFDVDAEEWVASFSMAAKRLEDMSDTEFEEAFDVAYETVCESYETEELRVLETDDDYADWWVEPASIAE